VSAVPQAPADGGSSPRRSIVPCRAGAHVGSPTVVDERARRLSHEEFAVANQLAAEGHRVQSVAERRGQGRVSDLSVCGAPVEVKSFLSLADREGRVPTARSVCNKLLGAQDQAPTAVLYAGRSGLSEAVARAGVEEFATRGRPGGITGIRVIGDGFDLSWSTSLLREAGADRGQPTVRRRDSTDTTRYQRRSDRSTPGTDRAAGRELPGP